MSEVAEQTDFDLLKSRKRILSRLQEEEASCLAIAKRVDKRQKEETVERQKRVEDDGNPYEQQYRDPPSNSNKVTGVVKSSGKRTIIKTSLPTSSKNVAVSAANIKRAPQTQNQSSDTKVTIMKRKTITGNSKR